MSIVNVYINSYIVLHITYINLSKYENIFSNISQVPGSQMTRRSFGVFWRLETQQ